MDNYLFTNIVIVIMRWGKIKCAAICVGLCGCIAALFILRRVGILSVVLLLVFVCRVVISMTGNVSICVRAGLAKPRPVPDTERNKDAKTLDYASTPLDANTLLGAGHSVHLY